MANGFECRLRFLVILLLLAFLFQRVDPTPCREKMLQNTNKGFSDILNHFPYRRLMLASNEFFVPKRSSGSRTRYDASDHNTPSGPNPIGNR